MRNCTERSIPNAGSAHDSGAVHSAFRTPHFAAREMAGRRIAEDPDDLPHGVPGVAEQIRGARRAREVDHALQVRGAAGRELARQVLARDPELARHVGGLGRDPEPAQHLVPGRELQAVGEPQQLRRVRQRLAAGRLGGPRRDPLARDRGVDALDEDAGEPCRMAGREQHPIVGAERRERVHRDAREAGGQREGQGGRGLHIQHDGVHQALVQQTLDRLEAAAQPHPAGAARVALLHRAARVAARVEHGHDGGRGRSRARRAPHGGGPKARRLAWTQGPGPAPFRPRARARRARCRRKSSAEPARTGATRNP